MAGFEFSLDRVTLYPNEMEHMLNSPSGDVGEHLYTVGMLMVQGAKRQVGVDSGRLRNSIGMEHHRGGSLGQYITVGSTVPYALDHHNGTPPHLILPKHHSFLRFTSGGRVIYSRQVMHPGTRPNHYLSDQLYLVRV